MTGFYDCFIPKIHQTQPSAYFDIPAGERDYFEGTALTPEGHVVALGAYWDASRIKRLRRVYLKAMLKAKLAGKEPSLRPELLGLHQSQGVVHPLERIPGLRTLSEGGLTVTWATADGCRRLRRFVEEAWLAVFGGSGLIHRTIDGEIVFREFAPSSLTYLHDVMLGFDGCHCGGCRLLRYGIEATCQIEDLEDA